MTVDPHSLNLASWEERVAIHLGPGGYDLTSHRAGMGRLDAIVESEIGCVEGKSILHLQCHIGHDSIALAHRGATVVGVDFSPSAIAAARNLAKECGAPGASFVESELSAVRTTLADRIGTFDMVFTTWGTICWLPDLSHWAETIRLFLTPGGEFYFADAHPVALVFDDVGGEADAEGRPDWLIPYFERGAQMFDEATDYANPAATLENTRTEQWMHPLADIVTALAASGLRMVHLGEHERITWRMFPGLVRDGDGLWTWPGRRWLPLALSLRAVAATDRAHIIRQ